MSTEQAALLADPQSKPFSGSRDRFKGTIHPLAFLTSEGGGWTVAYGRGITKETKRCTLLIRAGRRD